tara:strand:+ start:254 stop:496 length:243 start_codon:yes stop_codon:yes gene_type:complete
MSISKQAAFDYFLNRFCPYGVIIALLFSEFNFLDFRPYCIVFLVWFIERFSFDIGHSCGTYENNDEVKRQIDREIEEDEL